MESTRSDKRSNGHVDLNGDGPAKLATNTSEQGGNTNGTSTGSSITSPPYWVRSHTRSFSNRSVESIPVGTITLQDNTDETDDPKNRACWAKSVYIEDHVVINGSRTGIGAFVVWNITVETLQVCYQSRWSLMRGLMKIGRVFSYSKALLRVRRPPSKPFTDLPKLYGCYARYTTKECDIKVPSKVSGASKSRLTILLKASLLPMKVCWDNS